MLATARGLPTDTVAYVTAYVFEGLLPPAQGEGTDGCRARLGPVMGGAYVSSARVGVGGRGQCALVRSPARRCSGDELARGRPVS
jgi:hypothetical protein